MQRDIAVLSGMALGIDAVAHTTAIQHGGRTIAVLGTPLDQFMLAIRDGGDIPMRQTHHCRIRIHSRELLSAMPDSSTGSRSGNVAISEKVPPTVLTVLRSVESSRSLRCSSRDTHG